MMMNKRGLWAAGALAITASMTLAGCSAGGTATEDGANDAGHARIFFTIILRLVASTLAVVALLPFIGTTNEFVVASVLLIDPEKQTLAVGLYKLVSSPNYADWSAFSAGAALATLPVMAFFLFLQKYIVGGLTAGSVK